jgi:hypothetical protein
MENEMKTKYIEYVREYERELFDEVGININDLNNEQLRAILVPVHAPEDYHQDGEISPDEAYYLHSQRLIQCGIVGELYIKAMKLTE